MFDEMSSDICLALSRIVKPLGFSVAVESPQPRLWRVVFLPKHEPPAPFRKDDVVRWSGEKDLTYEEITQCALRAFLGVEQ